MLSAFLRLLHNIQVHFRLDFSHGSKQYCVDPDETALSGVMLQILDWGLVPWKLGKIPMFYLKLGKINCDTISKHINDLVIFIHQNLNCRPV